MLFDARVAFYNVLHDMELAYPTESVHKTSKLCNIPLQVAYAIKTQPEYVIGSLYERRILLAEFNHQKAKSRNETLGIVKRNGYKETRDHEPPRRGNRISEMKSL